MVNIYKAVRDNATYFYNWMKKLSTSDVSILSDMPLHVGCSSAYRFFVLYEWKPSCSRIYYNYYTIFGDHWTSFDIYELYGQFLAIVGTTVFEIESILASQLNRPNSWKDLKEHTVEINHLSFSYNREKKR